MKKIIWLTLLLMMSMVGIVYGAASFVTPTDGATITSAGEVQNVSVLSTLNVTNCTWSGSSVKTGGSFSYAYNLTPATLDATDNISNVSSIGVQWDLLRDADDWILTGTCYNQSAEGSETITPITVTIDLTQPTCSLSGVSSGNHYQLEETTITVTGTNASSSATIYFNGNSYSMTKGTVAEAQTYTYSTSSLGTGIYDVYAITSDATNETTCTTVTGVQLDKSGGGSGGGGGSYSTSTTTPSTQSTTPPPSKGKIGLGTIIVILIILYFVGKNQKWF